MQLMPATASRFGVSNLYDPKENVHAGARYLKFLMDRFGQNVRLALAAYNAGEEAVERNGGQIPPLDAGLALDRAQDRQTVRAAIEQLPAEFREAITLRELEGMSYKEIADIAGVPIGTIMSRLARARRQLQLLLMKTYTENK